MNADRRKRLEAIVAALNEQKTELEGLRDEEQEAYDSMPEGLQQGEKGQATEAAAGSLSEAVDNLDSAVNSIEEATNQ